ncbi:MAG: hypothetical protein L6R41_000375 [Letrouitia leprolyta]|nr:MAG: hypothetical protein L6R41_000375 [Letrouitia leprolyta]
MSGSASHYKFSDIDGYNDEQALNKALGKMKIGQPSSHGGVFHDTANENVQYASFNLHTPPDIIPKTRILAVCGPKQSVADPGKDGWFISDFWAFHHLFNGLTPNQCWMHCLDFDQLLSIYPPYLHGNPFKTRKVVLDRGILAKATNLVKISTPGGLRLAFKNKLRDECRAAARAGDESVLVFMFGHGSKDNGGVELGTNFLKQAMFSEAIAGIDVPLTLISTACYSGGWSCNLENRKDNRHYNKSGVQFNKGTMMAAGKNQPSRSWNYTTTLRLRACGSVFASALINAMTTIGATGRNLISEGNEDDDDDEQEKTKEQEETYEEFTRAVYETLLKDVDRRGQVHGITFSAEADAWSMCWRERTGIPLAAFQKRWNQLEDHDADPHMHPGDLMNRDSYVTQEQEEEYRKLKLEDGGKNLYEGKSAGGYGALGSSIGTSVLGKRKTSALCGGSIEAMAKQISCLGHQYLESYRGFETTGDDGALYRLITRIQRGDERSLEELQLCQRALDFRMGQMTTADDYMRAMQIPLPHGKLCHEFDVRGVVQGVGEEKYEDIYGTIRARKILFPSPVEDQGRPFTKGIDYLVAAIHLAKLDKATTIGKLDALARTVKEELDHQKDMMKDIPEIRAKRQKLFRAFGVNLGNISPAKRRSVGQSFGG